VVVRLLYGGAQKITMLAKTTPVGKMWDVMGDGVCGGARLLVAPSGREVAMSATVGQIVCGRQPLTLELRLSGIGGGIQQDEKLQSGVTLGDLEKVAEALDQGANVNTKTQVGGRNVERTPLHWAAAGGHAKVAQVLVDRGADVNATDNLVQALPV